MTISLVGAKGIHPNCFGNGAAYAIDGAIAKAALDAFDEAMALAGDAAVRARVEKASICAHRAAIEEACASMEDAPLDAAVAARLRPAVRRFLELCAKHKVPMFAETIPMDQARRRERRNGGHRIDRRPREARPKLTASSRSAPAR